MEETIEKTLKPIAKEGFNDALEILQLIAVLRAQNSNNVNKGLSSAGAGRAAITARNALITRLTLLVVRSYAKAKKDGDLQIRKAYDLIIKDTRLREELERRNPAGSVTGAVASWKILRGDHRLQRLEHFRDKYTAHLSEPDKDVPLPTYDELFPFAVETTKVMQALANITGVNNHKLEDWDDELTGSAEAFWRPWSSATKEGKVTRVERRSF